MGISVGGKHGVVSDPNVVPLIDILLVLLVIFMLIPHSRGLRAQIPQECVARDGSPYSGGDKSSVVVIQVLADGSFQVNQEPVKWENLESRLTRIFAGRADRSAFIRGDASVEFAVVARVIDVMHTAGIAPVGLLTPHFKNGQYDAAIEDFKQAKELDPSLINARLYLATAYASQYIPGAPSEQNIRLGTQAVNEFKDVLSIAPNNLSAIDGIGSIIFQMA